VCLPGLRRSAEGSGQGRGRGAGGEDRDVHGDPAHPPEEALREVRDHCAGAGTLAADPEELCGGLIAGIDFHVEVRFSSCATNTSFGKTAWNCERDEGRSLASDDQELDANRCKLLLLRAMVVSVAERVGSYPTWVRTGETSESKPSVNCRNRIFESKTGSGETPGISVGGALKTGLRALRLEDGVTPDQALSWNVGTCRLDVKVTVQVGLPDKALGTDARHRGRAARSRVEGAVTALDRRGGDILPDSRVNR
jgi:hypothetical protein